MSRYSDIKKGPELAQQLTAYQAYLQKTQAQKRADYAALNVNRVVASRVKANIRPFGSTNLLVPVLTVQAGGTPDTSDTPAESRSIDSILVDLLRGALTGRIEVTEAETDNVIGWGKFRAAKLFVGRRDGGTIVERTSRFTGRTYRAAPGNVMSCNFGKSATATDTFEAARTAIKANPALVAFDGAADGNFFRITPQLDYA